MSKDDDQVNTVGNTHGRKAGKDALGVNSEIGRKLRQMYDDVAADSVPDRFLDLLSQLEQAESTQKKG